MPPIPHDSDDDPSEDMFAPIDDVNIDDTNDVEIMTLNENDQQPGLDELTEEMGLDGDEDLQIENGYIPDDSIMVFQQHDGSVFSIAMSNTSKSMVVSGGEDDQGYIWKAENGEVVLQCDGHKDSVISCGFNYDDKYVMTADMSGLIIVRNVTDGERVWEFECSDLEWCFWHPAVNVLFAGTTEGEIYMWKIPSGDCKIYQGHGSKALAGKLMPSGKELLAAYEDATLKIWDLKNATAVVTHHSEGEMFLCVDCQSSGSLIACGTLEGTTKLFSVTSGKNVANLSLPSAPMNSDEGTSRDRNIESMAFSPTEQFLAVGSLDGTLQIWDLTTHRLRHTCEHPAGVTHVIWHENDSGCVTTACLDGVVRQWDYKNAELLKTFQGHQDGILDVCVSKDGKTILTAGDDKCARIFEK